MHTDYYRGTPIAALSAILSTMICTQQGGFSLSLSKGVARDPMPTVHNAAFGLRDAFISSWVAVYSLKRLRAALWFRRICSRSRSRSSSRRGWRYNGRPTTVCNDRQHATPEINIRSGKHVANKFLDGFSLLQNARTGRAAAVANTSASVYIYVAPLLIVVNNYTLTGKKLKRLEVCTDYFGICP